MHTPTDASFSPAAATGGSPLAPAVPGVPPVSKKDAPAFHSAEHRDAGAEAFRSGARDYEDARPGYLPAALDLLGPFDSALDVGCGTGKLTADLLGRGLRVVGLDPSQDMLREFSAGLPGVGCVRARAESLPFTGGAFDAVTCAQTWHWLDHEAASRELARVTTPDARVLLVWNTFDVLVPWVHRLSRIMHSGDTLKEGFVPNLGPQWRIEKTLRTRWEQQLYPQQLHDLTHTRSYWLRSNEKTRARVTANLDWYLYDHLQLDPRAPVGLPYRLDAFLLVKANLSAQA